MKRLPALLLAAAFAVGPGVSQATEKSVSPAFEFRGVSYFHRWSGGEQHEFTPEEQEDLDHWSDMITVNGYPDVRDGDGLAATANAVLDNYKSHGGQVLKTNSVPRTADRPAEHFIAVMFEQPALVEIAFARFKLRDNKGGSYVYSHRFYGEKKSAEASAWMKANRDALEKSLMDWDPDKTEAGPRN